MSCYFPLKGWLKVERNESGKRSITFSRVNALIDRPVVVPCGKCVGCLSDRSRSWAVRCLHESQEFEQNCFLTLTFDDDWLFKNGRNGQNLVKEDFVLFMKRLREFNCRFEFVVDKNFNGYYRKRDVRLKKSGIRFFHCGEYGDFGRAHHHACIFNFDFEDKLLYERKNNVNLYRSETLERLWPMGFCTIGDVTPESAAYVARYCLKKLKKKDDGDRVKEYVTMSRKPGIGRNWIERYFEEVYRNDFLLMNGKRMKSPKYYDRYFDGIDSCSFNELKRKRMKRAQEDPENMPARLRARFFCHRDRLKKAERRVHCVS